MADQLPVSDFTPGIAAPATALDWETAKCDLDRFEAKLNSLRPIVKKSDGLFTLYQFNQLVVRAPSAQMILNYCEAMFPKGTKIQWIIVA